MTFKLFSSVPICVVTLADIAENLHLEARQDEKYSSPRPCLLHLRRFAPSPISCALLHIRLYFRTLLEITCLPSPDLYGPRAPFVILILVTKSYSHASTSLSRHSHSLSQKHGTALSESVLIRWRLLIWMVCSHRLALPAYESIIKPQNGTLLLRVSANFRKMKRACLN